MMLLDVALDCIRRGWFVLPCVPKDKRPLIKGAWKASSNDEAQVRAWWTKWPDANVGIAVQPSGLTVVDMDHGVNGPDDLERVCAEKGLPLTYAVRTGRRPEYGVQLYYAGEGVKSIAWEDGDIAGDTRGTTGHVMAAGSIHPSGEAYTTLWDLPLKPVPNYVRALKARPIPGLTGGENPEFKDDGGPIAQWRNVAMISLLGKKRGEGATDDELREYAVKINEARMSPPLDDDELERLISNACKFPIPEPEPIPVLSKHKEPERVVVTDWRELFHTKDEVLNCPPPTFLVDQFLARESICAIAAPVAQRKSLIALNVARSLCTGAPLFGSLQVKNRPSRVLYLCPEMGLVSLSERIRKIGVGDCLGDTLFLRSMNMGTLELLDIPEAALDGSVLIIDTAIRFLKGDENSSEDMQVFSDTLFTIQRRQGTDGAIMALYHSPKATKDASELTLENCLRGSGELGAAITDAHGTRLQDPTAPYDSLSFIRHIKCRDYEGLKDGFEVSGDKETGILQAVGDPFAAKATLKLGIGGNRANRDGKDEAARAIIRANATLTIPALIGKLQEAGIDRKKTWVTLARMDVTKPGVQHISG